MEQSEFGTSWHAYPSVFAMGHRLLQHLLDDTVVVEEKVDGSQFSFGRFKGELKCRSRKVQLDTFAPQDMFKKAVEVISSLDLHDGWTYRAEYLSRPKHNVLAYDRVPNNGIIIFDINIGEEEYLNEYSKKQEAERLGLECVPVLHSGVLTTLEKFQSFLEMPSILGGQKVEGVVVKNYAQFGPDKKVLMGKYVSEQFKEHSVKVWGEMNPKQGDILQRIIATYHSSARWAKAVQHLKEAGLLEGHPRDIALLMKEVPKDIEEECKAEIIEMLWTWAWSHVRRGVTSGAAEWYKEQLLREQFVETNDATS